MKKFFFIFLVLLALPTISRGESVFELELECAQRTLRSGRANYISVQFAQFQEVALLYLREKQQNTRDTMRINRHWLDTQALNMADFLSLYYMSFVNDTLTGEDYEVLRLIFRDVSLSTPCFYDANERITLQFVLPEESKITPFSLDTDWPKAYQKIQNELLESKYKWIVEQYQDIRKKLSCSNEN